MSFYYEQNNQVYNEREIVTKDRKIIIPDRLVLRNKKMTVIDYKTGDPTNNHHSQLITYAAALEELNYTVEKKLLVYINEEILVEEI